LKERAVELDLVGAEAEGVVQGMTDELCAALGGKRVEQVGRILGRIFDAFGAKEFYRLCYKENKDSFAADLVSFARGLIDGIVSTVSHSHDVHLAEARREFLSFLFCIGLPLRRQLVTEIGRTANMDALDLLCQTRLWENWAVDEEALIRGVFLAVAQKCLEPSKWAFAISHMLGRPGDYGEIHARFSRMIALQRLPEEE
jgi:hypothetical protein